MLTLIIMHEIQSRFECIEGVAQSEELVQIYWE
jgi:hypothetical protein